MNNFRFAFEFPLGAKDTESAAYLLSLVDNKRLQKIDRSVLRDNHARSEARREDRAKHVPIVSVNVDGEKRRLTLNANLW